MISALFFFKFVDKNRVKKKKKSLILGMDSGKCPLFSMFNVDSYAPVWSDMQSLHAPFFDGG